MAPSAQDIEQDHVDREDKDDAKRIPGQAVTSTTCPAGGLVPLLRAVLDSQGVQGQQDGGVGVKGISPEFIIGQQNIGHQDPRVTRELRAGNGVFAGHIERQPGPAQFFADKGRLSFDPESGSSNAGFDEYVSDPAKPVPYTMQTIARQNREYFVEDQRFAASRPDVLVYSAEPLAENLAVAGQIKVEPYVATTGTDADWVVKLIDVYPDNAPDPKNNPADIRMGGYQRLIRGDIFRGKFRNSFERPEPFVPDRVTKVAFELPDVQHALLKGHRIMVQVQSSWFPLFDRNPQTFCNIRTAVETDFRKATNRLYHSTRYPSAITFRVLAK